MAKILKFLKNTAYAGKEYGPDYKPDTVEVDDSWAVRFLASGRCVEAKSKPSASEDTSSEDTASEGTSSEDAAKPKASKKKKK